MLFRNLLIFFLLSVSINAFSQDTIVDKLKKLFEEKKYDDLIHLHLNKNQDCSAKALYYIAMAYYIKGDDSNCLKLVNQSIKKDSKDPNAHHIKGMTLYYLNNFDDAILSFKKAIEIYPKSGDFYTGLGDSYFRKKEFQKAINSYLLAIKQDNVTDSPYYMISKSYVYLNKREKALKAFYEAKKKIKKGTEHYKSILYNIGLYEYKKGNFDKAEYSFIELINIQPDFHHAYSKLIQVYYAKKEYLKAIPYKEKLYQAHFNNKIIERNLKDMFCFDQFTWKDKLVQVYEKFNEKEGELYYKHLFYIVNKNDDIEYRIQTENSPVSIEQGGPKYTIGMNKDGTHKTFGFIEENFKYERLKSIIINILETELY